MHSLLGDREEVGEENDELTIGDGGHHQSEGKQSTFDGTDGTILDGVEAYNPRDAPKTHVYRYECFLPVASKRRKQP